MRDITYPPIIGTAKVAFKLLGLKFQLTGSEHVPRTGGAILVMNHISYVDYILGGYAMQPHKRLVRFMAKKEIFDNAMTGPVMRSLHHIPVDRASGIESYNQAVEYARAGEIVGVFPESTISRSMQLREFKSGAVRMSAESGVPILPLIIWGSQRIVTKDHPKDFGRGKTIALNLGEPFHPDGGNAVAETAALHKRMSAMLDETIRAYPVRPEGQWWAPAAYGGGAPTPEEAIRLDRKEKLARVAQARAARDKA